jgi:hypothetical protein
MWGLSTEVTLYTHCSGWIKCISDSGHVQLPYTETAIGMNYELWTISESEPLHYTKLKKNFRENIVIVRVLFVKITVLSSLVGI